jgi:hypothetical protein
MKKLTTIFAVSTLLLGAYAAQAHVANHEHKHGDLYNKVQAMTPADRASFEEMMHSNMDKMSGQEKQAFMNRMRASQGFNKSEQHDMHRQHDAQAAVNSMSTMERAGFINMMRSNMTNMSDLERNAFFDYIGMDKQDKHSFFERLGIKHQKQERKSHEGCNSNYDHNESNDK